MKLRHFAAIFCFLAAFGLSVFLVRLSTPKSCSASIPSKKKQTVVVNSETELQTRIRKFLEADLQTGIELTNDKVRLSHSNNRLNAERIATLNLVEKMRKVECGVGMPKGFCLAWDEHVWSWQKKAEFLDKDFKNIKFPEVEGDEYEYRKLNERISKTYQDMLEQARREGVDFKY